MSTIMRVATIVQQWAQIALNIPNVFFFNINCCKGKMAKGLTTFIHEHDFVARESSDFVIEILRMCTH